VPKQYIKAVADLETVMLETIQKQKVTPKKMNAINTRGLNAVRQSIRKNNKEYEKDIEAYRANEEEFMAEKEPEEVKKPAKKPKKTLIGLDVDDVAADEGDFITVGAGGRAVQYTPEGILKTIKAIVDQRGRKGTDRMEHIRTLEKLLDIAVQDYQRIRVLLTLISTRFDLTSGTGNQMSQEQWKLYVLVTRFHR
jgi:translation initiation factor 3 subunit C